MRSEEFDKLFQQKLEELNPEFNETDWTRLSLKMKAQQSPMLFYKKMALILLLLFLVLFSTWISFHWDAFKAGNEIDNSIHKVQLPAKMASKSALNANDNSDNESISPVETLSSNQMESTVKLQSATTTRHHSVNSSFTENQIQSKERKVENTNSKSQQIGLNSSNQKDPAIVINANSSTNGNPSINETAKESNISKSLNDNAGISQNAVIKESNTDNAVVSESVNIATATATEIEIQESKVSPMALLPIMAVKDNKKPYIASRLKTIAGLKPNKWIVGAMALGTKSHLNTGLAFEIKSNNNISFSSGLVMQKYFMQDYVDQKAFSETNNANFADMIRPRDSKSTSFSNISINSMDVLLPLSLKYYYPLSTRYSLFVNAGVQLTLYSKTSLDFAYVEPYTNVQKIESNFDQASNSSTLINHFTLGAGIQREFRNLIFQASFVLQKNNNNQPQITKQEPAGQIGIFYKL